MALGDLDGDGKDEIVLAGLTGFEFDSCDQTTHVYLALEDAHDAANPLGPIGGQVYSYNYIPTGIGCNSSSHFLRMRHVFVKRTDIDGDGLAEVQANLRIFDDWKNAAPWTEIHTLPDDEMLTLSSGQTSGGTVSRATADIVTGDVNGDGRDDVISFVPWRNEISVWGLDGPSPESAQWKAIVRVPTQFYNGQSRIFPIVLPCNVDHDGLALKYSDAEYRLVFTAPIIMAALAAAPAQSGINQNYDACRTSYGTSERQNLGVNGTVSVRASAWVGTSVEFFGIGAEVKQTVTRTASFSAGRSYELEQTIEYTTGPMEDTVICTTLPIDQYTYTVVSHPDPTMVGQKMVVNLPRTPITLQVEREFFNASVPAGSFQVGRNVFLHTPGDVASYPTAGDADALIDTGGLGHLGPLGELVDAAGAARPDRGTFARQGHQVQPGGWRRGQRRPEQRRAAFLRAHRLPRRHRDRLRALSRNDRRRARRRQRRRQRRGRPVLGFVQRDDLPRHGRRHRPVGLQRQQLPLRLVHVHLQLRRPDEAAVRGGELLGGALAGSAQGDPNVDEPYLLTLTSADRGRRGSRVGAVGSRDRLPVRYRRAGRRRSE